MPDPQIRQPHVFTIAPGVPFLPTFVAALLDGRVIDGFSRALGPLDMADATIYVPTRRAARALIDAFARDLDRPATLLPRILPLGALDATEESLIFEDSGFETPFSESLPPAAPEFWRRMQCARMTLAWARAVHHAIIAVDPGGKRLTDSSEALLVGTSSLDAWHLAGELTGLIDEMIIEDVDWRKLDPLVLPEFDRYWRITLDFLDIAMQQWPHILAEAGLVDAAERRNRLIDEQMRAIQSGGMGGPVIALGSTGSNRATARLLAAIARAPRGAVVLPGLDLDLDDESWRHIGADGDGAADSSFGHPQASLRRLLPILGVARTGVVELGRPTPTLAARRRLVSEALRPADTTDQWRDYRGKTTPEEIAAVLAAVTLIEAADDREEALALAIALRHALETPEATAALVTPDRDLARRVAVELARWGIEIDDSAGESLRASPCGVLASLVAACAANDFAAADVAALLDHPYVRLGRTRDEIARLAPAFEIGLLRCGFEIADHATTAEAIAAARQAAAERFAHPAQARISTADWDALAGLLDDLTQALGPLAALTERHDLLQWTAAHRQAFEAVIGGAGELPTGDDFDALAALFDEIAANALPDLSFDAEAYGLFIAGLAAQTMLRRARRTHPRLKIYGLLEARLLAADVMLLGGLDETVWPPQAKGDPFLNRPMRTALGLSPPERRLGQTAHDFAAGMGHPHVVLSRAMKRGGAPTVASRFLQRLAAVAGPHFDAVRTRGEDYLRLARAIDRPKQASAPIQRPMPKPDVALRPRRLSVTRIEMLRRDPYAVYAETILKLAPLPPLGRDGGAQLFGSAMHAVLEAFVRRVPAGPLPPDAGDVLAAMLRETFAKDLADADFVAFQWPMIVRAIDFYIAFESARRPMIARIDVEARGTLDIPLADGSTFTLSAVADRIEHHADGSVVLVDYKTGTPPGVSEVLVGFAPQLTLEAAMARRGAFGLPSGTSVDGALYLKLGGRSGGAETQLDFDKNGSFGEVAERHFAGLLGLLNQFRAPDTPYPPRPFPKFAARYNDYDHLARVKEWSSGVEPGGAA